MTLHINGNHKASARKYPSGDSESSGHLNGPPPERNEVLENEECDERENGYVSQEGSIEKQSHINTQPKSKPATLLENGKRRGSFWPFMCGK